KEKLLEAEFIHRETEPRQAAEEQRGDRGERRRVHAVPSVPPEGHRLQQPLVVCGGGASREKRRRIRENRAAVVRRQDEHPVERKTRDHREENQERVDQKLAKPGANLHLVPSPLERTMGHRHAASWAWASLF